MRKFKEIQLKIQYNLIWTEIQVQIQDFAK